MARKRMERRRKFQLAYIAMCKSGPPLIFIITQSIEVSSFAVLILSLFSPAQMMQMPNVGLEQAKREGRSTAASDGGRSTRTAMPDIR